VRRPISLKPNTCTERLGVDAAGISGKGLHLTLGGLPVCLLEERMGYRAWRHVGRHRQKSAEGIVVPKGEANSREEGPNTLKQTGA
jgi:hypothetical protein